jgi:hypothetical protein
MINSQELLFSSQIQDTASSELNQDKPHNNISAEEYRALPVTAPRLPPITTTRAPVPSGKQYRENP